MRRLIPIVVALATPLAVTSTTYSLMPTDPNAGDTVYGTVAGVRYASEANPLNSTQGYASAIAGCGTSGKRFIGGGAVAHGLAAHTWLEYMRPVDYLDADVEPDDGFYASGFVSGTETVRTFSICIVPSQLDYRDLQVAPESGERDGTLKCVGAGRHVVAGSAGVASTGSWLTSSFPIDDADPGTTRDDGWRATAYDTANTSQVLRIDAVCAKNLAHHYVKSGPSTVQAHAAPTVTVSCGADHVIGGGVKVSGDPDGARLVMSAPYDSADAGNIPDDGWRTKVYNAGPGSKQITSFAICLET